MTRILYKKIIPMCGVLIGTSTLAGASDAVIPSTRRLFVKVKKVKFKLLKRNMNGSFNKNGSQKSAKL